MRRLLFIAAAGVLFASCSKEYKCRCVSTVVGSTDGGDSTEFAMAVSKKSDANKKCQQYQNQYQAQFGSGAGVTKNFTCTVQ